LWLLIIAIWVIVGLNQVPYPYARTKDESLALKDYQKKVLHLREKQLIRLLIHHDGLQFITTESLKEPLLTISSPWCPNLLGLVTCGRTLATGVSCCHLGLQDRSSAWLAWGVD